MEEDAFDGTGQSPGPVIRAHKTMRAVPIVIWIVVALQAGIRVAIHVIDENTRHAMRYGAKGVLRGVASSARGAA